MAGEKSSVKCNDNAQWYSNHLWSLLGPTHEGKLPEKDEDGRHPLAPQGLLFLAEMV